MARRQFESTIRVLNRRHREVSVNQWMRPSDQPGQIPEQWHWQHERTRSGLRVARCGTSYVAGDKLEQRAYNDPPDIEDRCLACDVAFVTVHIPVRPGHARVAILG